MSVSDTNAVVGQSFKTGNSVVAGLAVGTVLEVVGKGQLEVVDLPEDVVDVAAGTRFTSKYGPATVVDFTSTGGFDDHVADASHDEEVFYIADGTSRVRRTSVSNIK